jgi:hypothetical protein
MNADDISQNYVMTMWFENPHDNPIRLIVEPWAYECDILPGEYIRIVARGPKSGCPTISQHKMDYIYYAWAGSVFVLYKNGKLFGGWNLDDCPPEPSPQPSDEKATENYKILTEL